MSKFQVLISVLVAFLFTLLTVFIDDFILRAHQNALDRSFLGFPFSYLSATFNGCCFLSPIDFVVNYLFWFQIALLVVFLLTIIFKGFFQRFFSPYLIILKITGVILLLMSLFPLLTRFHFRYGIDLRRLIAGLVLEANTIFQTVSKPETIFTDSENGYVGQVKIFLWLLVLLAFIFYYYFVRKNKQQSQLVLMLTILLYEVGFIFIWFYHLAYIKNPFA